MVSQIKIAIAEPAPIVRAGIEAQLRKLLHHKAQVIYLLDIFLINPLLTGPNPRTLLPHLPEQTKLVAFSYTPADPLLVKEFDGVIHLTDGVLQISELIDRLLQNESHAPEVSQDSQTLTPREREIIICVVKGMTNKEIAGRLYLSTHTVITHRRNITKKLQIHSSSGLTIYAIMNKLVELDEIKQDL